MLEFPIPVSPRERRLLAAVPACSLLVKLQGFRLSIIFVFKASRGANVKSARCWLPKYKNLSLLPSIYIKSHV